MRADFKGLDGVIELLDDRVIIRKTAGVGAGTGSDETQFMLSQMDGIEYSKSSMLLKKRGHLAVLAAGCRPYQKPIAGEPDTRLTAKNTVTFWSTDNKKAEEFKSQLEQALQAVHSTSKLEAAQVAPSSAADEIGKFKALLDDGTITQEEFEVKKKQLLGL